MSAKTRIVVLHMKELIYTGIFAALGVLLVIVLIIMFLPEKGDSGGSDPNTPPAGTEESAGDGEQAADQESTETASADVLYIPGVYATELVLGGQSVDVEVIVEKDAITSIRLVNLDEAVTTMYPLLQPTLDSICQQVYEKQALENVTYTAESKYTSLVLLEAIRNSLDKALVENAAQAEEAAK